MANGVVSWQQLVEWMDIIECTRLLSVLLTPKHRKIRHSSWSTLGGLLEIHLSLTVSSDACKGLENAVKVVFPHVE
jgi:hypothetical protein